MKHWTQKDLIVPCMDCAKLPDIEWDMDDLKISCGKCCITIYRNCKESKAVSTIDYVLEQINMWNRVNGKIPTITLYGVDKPKDEE
jgi:hypothetical protein